MGSVSSSFERNDDDDHPKTQNTHTQYLQADDDIDLTSIDVTKFPKSTLKATGKLSGGHYIIVYDNFDIVLFDELCENLQAFLGQINKFCITFLILENDNLKLNDQELQTAREKCNTKHYNIYKATDCYVFALKQIYSHIGDNKIQLKRSPIESIEDSQNIIIYLNELYKTSFQVADVVFNKKNNRFEYYVSEKSLPDISQIYSNDEVISGFSVPQKTHTHFAFSYVRKRFGWNKECRLVSADKSIEIVRITNYSDLLILITSFSLLKSIINNIVIAVMSKSYSDSKEERYIVHYLQHSLDNYTNATYKYTDGHYILSNGQISIPSKHTMRVELFEKYLKYAEQSTELLSDHYIASIDIDKGNQMKILNPTQATLLSPYFSGLSHQYAIKLKSDTNTLTYLPEFSPFNFVCLDVTNMSIEFSLSMIDTAFHSKNKDCVLIFRNPTFTKEDLLKIVKYPNMNILEYNGMIILQKKSLVQYMILPSFGSKTEDTKNPQTIVCTLPYYKDIATQSKSFVIHSTLENPKSDLKKITNNLEDIYIGDLRKDIKNEKNIKYQNQSLLKQVFVESKWNKFPDKYRINSLFYRENECIYNLRKVMSSFQKSHIIVLHRGLDDANVWDLYDLFNYDKKLFTVILVMNPNKMAFLDSFYKQHLQSMCSMMKYTLYDNINLDEVYRNSNCVVVFTNFKTHFNSNDNILQFKDAFKLSIEWDYSKNTLELIDSKSVVVNNIHDSNIIIPRKPLSVYSEQDELNEYKTTIKSKNIILSSGEYIGMKPNPDYEIGILRKNMESRFDIFNDKLGVHLFAMRMNEKVDINHEYMKQFNSLKNKIYNIIYIPNVYFNTVKECMKVFSKEIYPILGLTKITLVFGLISSNHEDDTVQNIFKDILDDIDYSVVSHRINNQEIITFYKNNDDIEIGNKGGITYTRKMSNNKKLEYKLVSSLESFNFTDEDFVMQYVNTQDKIKSKVSFNHRYSNVKLFDIDLVQYTCYYIEVEEPVYNLIKYNSDHLYHRVFLYNHIKLPILYLILKMLKSEYNPYLHCTILFTLHPNQVFKEHVNILQYVNKFLNTSKNVEKWSVFSIPEYKLYCISTDARAFDNEIILKNPEISIILSNVQNIEHFDHLYFKEGNDKIFYDYLKTTSSIFHNHNYNTGIIRTGNDGVFMPNESFETFLLYTHMEKHNYININNFTRDIWLQQYRDNQDNLKVYIYELEWREFNSIMTFFERAHRLSDLCIIKIKNHPYGNKYPSDFNQITVRYEKIGGYTFAIVFGTKDVKILQEDSKTKDYKFTISIPANKIPDAKNEQTNESIKYLNFKLLITADPKTDSPNFGKSKEYDLILADDIMFNPLGYGYKIQGSTSLSYTMNKNNFIEYWTADLEHDLKYGGKELKEFEPVANSQLALPTFTITIQFISEWFKHIFSDFNKHIEKPNENYLLFIINADQDNVYSQRIPFHRTILKIIETANTLKTLCAILFNVNTHVAYLPSNMDKSKRIYSDKDLFESYMLLNIPSPSVDSNNSNLIFVEPNTDNSNNTFSKCILPWTIPSATSNTFKIHNTSLDVVYSDKESEKIKDKNFIQFNINNTSEIRINCIDNTISPAYNKTINLPFFGDSSNRSTININMSLLKRI